MLLADKCDLQEQLKRSLVVIEDKELSYFTQNCATLGTQAALVAGFVYSALVEVRGSGLARRQREWGSRLTMRCGWIAQLLLGWLLACGDLHLASPRRVTWTMLRRALKWRGR